MQGEILAWLQLQPHSVPAACICTDKPNAKRAWNRNDICSKTWNVCNFLNIILDWLALFQMCVQTMYTDKWPSKGIPAAAQWNGLCRTNLICGFAETMQGFEQICRALGLGDEEEQHRGEWGLCELSKVWRPLAGHSKTWPRRTSPCRGNKMGNHYKCNKYQKTKIEDNFGITELPKKIHHNF